MSTRGLLHRLDGEADPGDAAAPGRSTLTSRLARAPQLVFRVETAEAAAALAERFGVRDGRGAAARGDAAVPRAESPAAVDPFGLHLLAHPVQLAVDAHSGLDDAQVRAAAAHGTAGPGTALPHLDAIQRSFGPHDVTGVVAHVGGAAADASAALGARAYATGDHVAFAEAPSLALAAHEAAHVVQQRAGVHLSSAVGRAGDAYEQHADAVAARVVAGESAVDLLGAAAGAGVQREAIQREAIQREAKPAGGDAAMAIEIVAMDAVLSHLRHAAQAFGGASHMAEIAYKFALTQASAKHVHDQADEDYKKAKEAYEKARAKGTFARLLETVTALAGLATGIGSIVSAAKGLYQTQKSLREAAGGVVRWSGMAGSKTGAAAMEHLAESAKQAKEQGREAIKAGGEVGKGWKELHGEPAGANPDTMLADANHAAISASNDVANQLAEVEGEFHVATIVEQARQGLVDMESWQRLMSHMAAAHQALPASGDGDVHAAFDELGARQREFATSMFKLQKAWVIYQEHGYDALADESERPIVDKLLGWAAHKDPRLAKVQYAMDQNMRQMLFHGSIDDIRMEANEQGMPQMWATTCHAYKNDFVQMESGHLYVSDPAVARELGLGLQAIESRWGEGDAERREDARFRGAAKYAVSIALCKALKEVGVAGTETNATVILTAASGTMKIEERHQGSDYEHWKDTQTFARFWHTHLGARYGFIKEVDASGPAEPIKQASDEVRKRSRRPWDPSHRGG